MGHELGYFIESFWAAANLVRDQLSSVSALFVSEGLPCRASVNGKF